MSVPHPPHKKQDPTELARKLAELNRSPFQELLERAIQGSPKTKDYEKLGEKSPDRHAQALVMLAKLSGYSEKFQVDQTVRVEDLSDIELDQRLKALEDALHKQQAELPELSD